MHRYFSLNAHLRRLFGKRVQKIPMDAGFSCPNRDGSISAQGCAFCNPSGSGSGLADSMDLATQWDHWRERLGRKYKADLFLAYLQSYTNTYGPPERIAEVLDALRDLPALGGVCVGTRPDCLDEGKIELLASLKRRPEVRTVMVELGLQSSCDATLSHINRGHTAADFVSATRLASEHGLDVVAHVVAGLPSPNGRETADDLVDTVRFVASLPVSGIKFHNLYVCRDTLVGQWWKEGRFAPMPLDEYLDGVARSLELLPPEVVIHRLHGDPAGDELLAPDWAGDRNRLLNAVRTHLEQTDTWQGKRNGAEAGPPSFWDPNSKENRNAG